MSQFVGGGDSIAASLRYTMKDNPPSHRQSYSRARLIDSARNGKTPASDAKADSHLDGEEQEQTLQRPNVGFDAAQSINQPYQVPFILSTFPWIVLTTAEAALLSVHGQNLLSQDPRDAEESCHAVLDIVLYDFPPEIFLQRPALIQGLFALLESKDIALSTPAFACLAELTQRFAARFYQATMGGGSVGVLQGRSLSLHGGGDGDCSMSVSTTGTGIAGKESQSYSRSSMASILSSRSSLEAAAWRESLSSSDASRRSTSSEAVEMESPEETFKLQLRQIPLPVYLCAVIDACLNLLTDETPLGISKPLHLLDLAARHLRSTVHSTVWTTDSPDSRKMAENLLHSLQAAGNRVMFHAKRTERVLHEARLSRLIYIGLCKTIFVLSDLVPVTQIESIPGSFRACLPWICQDEGLALSYPAIREGLSPYLKASHPPGWEIYRQAKEISAAMSDACQFLHDTTESSSCTYQSDAEKAVQALPSLVYHQSEVFIQKCFQLCSDALGRGATTDNTKPFTHLMLRLLAYPNSAVQKQVYEILWHFCRAVLNVRTAADPTRTPGYDVLFLAGSKPLLREIILYGLFQSDTRVFAQNILSLLSQKFLINNAAVWNRLRAAMKPLFCGVFIHADLDTDFGRRVVSFSQEQDEDNALFDDTTRGRAAYSLMFHHNRLIRGHATDLILRRIGEFRIHGDTLISEAQYVFETDDSTEPFSTETLERGLKVWSDSRMDIAVRWTALRQIYIHLRRPVAQESFVRLKGPQSLFAMLSVIASGTEKDWSVENMALLLDSVLAVVYYNDKWRLDNCHELRLYDVVIGAMSHVHTGSVHWCKVQSAGSSIIFLLSFADVLLRKDGSLSICCTFYRSVLFPLTLMFHDFNKKDTKGANCDLLRSPVAEMLVLHWNVTLAGGIDQFLSAENRDDLEADFAPRLVIDDRAKDLIRVTHPHFGFVSACRQLESAKHHSEAVEALDIMSAYLLLWPFLPKEKIEDIPVGVESCFRYITVLPHNSSDLNLLRAVADFVIVGIERYQITGKCGPLPQWLTSLVIDHGSLFLEAVRKANKELSLLSSGRASLRVPYILANKSFVTSAWRLFGIVPQIKGDDELDVLELLELFVETLRTTLILPTVDFGALGRVCRSVAHYCGLPSIARQPETISFVPVLITTLQVAHQSNPDATSSFTGRSVIQASSLALLTLLTYQVENGLFPAMLESWKDETGTLSWLIAIWANRDPLVRSTGLSLAAGLSQTKEGRSLIIASFKFVPGGVWNAALSFLFSADEPDLVKYGAVNLLSAMLRSDLKRVDLALRDDTKNVNLEGTEALCAMLDQLGFYRAVLQVCQSFDGTRKARMPTEYLLGAVFNLCGTLMKLVGRRAVVNLKGLKFFHSALHVCFLVKVLIQESAKLPDRLNMFRDLFGMVGQAVQADESITEIVSYNMHSVSAALCLLDPAIAPAAQMRDLWTNIYILLAECLQNRLVLDSVWRLLSENQRTIYANTRVCLNLVITDPDNRRLQVALLTVLEVITESDRSEVEHFLWKPAVATIAPATPQCIGLLLTHFLVEKFSEPAALQVDAWVELLKRLLLRHEQVRAVAMDCGLMETVIDMVLDMDSTISKDIHVHSRSVLRKKMTEPLRMCLELLMNLMFRNTKGKQLAAQRSLASVLISLWITIIHDTEVLHILFLKLLCTFGARCQDALASFVRESEHAHTAPLTLFHVVISDLEEQLAQTLPHPDITPLLFDILGQMSLNPLCRVAIRKSVSVKKSMPIPSPRKPRVLQAVDAMWLNVLANLSFFEDGQLVILSKEDICTVLFDYLEIEGLFPEIYTSSMLILRNLAFCKKGMVRLTGARGVLARLVRLSSSHPSPKVRLYALSCLLELLYDQIKLRHAAKAISFDEFGRGKPDDEPQMFDLRARLLACLDTDSNAALDYAAYDDVA
ncbi:putative Rotatin [Hypsibius exemplaris]|uniref:Rotatin n=1 Tax=Hypsibius exemplaris TaxID=2072580 RepID=A0A1W0XCI3_HYPEX|nr:putative Rotatin [Hypsibius exemplaris]